MASITSLAAAGPIATSALLRVTRINLRVGRPPLDLAQVVLSALPSLIRIGQPSGRMVHELGIHGSTLACARFPCGVHRE